MRLERACGAPVSAAKLFVLHLRASGTQFITLHFPHSKDLQALTSQISAD
jgi:hypothetical protein